jgi:hypothetical protein
MEARKSRPRGARPQEEDETVDLVHATTVVPTEPQVTAQNINRDQAVEQDAAWAPGDLLAFQTEQGQRAVVEEIRGRMVPDMPDDALVEVPGLGVFTNHSREAIISPVEESENE